MRRIAPVGLFSVLVPALLAVPVMTPAASGSRAHAVPSSVQSLAVAGVDRAALTTAKRPGQPTGEPFLLTAPTETREFTTMGVTWEPGSGSPAVTVSARTRGEDGWSPWAPLELAEDGGPDASSPEATGPDIRTGTAPVWVGEASGVQVRVDVPSGPTPQDVRVELVDPGKSAADASLGADSVPASTATAASRQPKIISREQWGADESIRGAAPSYASAVKVAYVHHTASTNSYTAEQAAAQLRGFYAYHVKSLGWSDIGYNFLVDRFGRIYEGRHGGISRAVIGAHAGGFNTGSMGVSMIGTHSTVAPTSATLTSVRDLLAWKLSLSGANPLGKATLTSGGGSSSKHPAGTKVSTNVILGHRETNATACPGDAGAAKLPGLRAAVAAAMDSAPTDSATPATPIGRKHAALGGASGFLGTATAAEAPVASGRYRDYRGGSIYWSPTTAAHEVHGDIAKTWRSVGGQGGPLGFPLSDETTTPDRIGRYNRFQRGAVYWSPATGAREVRGAILEAWGAVRWEAGPLGYPVTGESPTRDGFGRYNHFRNGSVYWTQATGAHSVQGAIRATWSSLGWEGGPLGYPVTGEAGTPDGRGRFTHFQQGSVYWTAATGAHEVRGAIQARWAGMGWEGSRLGYPTSNEYDVPGGRRSDFQNGSITWDAATGSVTVR